MAGDLNSLFGGRDSALKSSGIGGMRVKNYDVFDGVVGIYKDQGV